MDDKNPEIMFIKDIIQIVKLIGNKMNEGYVYKQDMKRFNLEILSGALFKLNPSDDSVTCLFDVVFKSYIKVNNLEDTIDTVKMLSQYCQQILKLKSVIWNESQLAGAFTLKLNEINQKCDSIDMIHRTHGDIPEDHTSDMIACLETRIIEVKKQSKEIGSDYELYIDAINKMRTYLGNDIEQGVASIVKFCEQCLKSNFNTDFDINPRRDEISFTTEIKYRYSLIVKSLPTFIL
jgi:hypothetical protein